VNTFRHKTLGKLFLLLFAVVIGMVSLVYTDHLVSKLKVEERKNVELWAQAVKLISISDSNQDVDFLSTIIDNNTNVPVILTDENENIISSLNFDKSKINDQKYLKKRFRKMKEKNEPIVIDLGNGHYNYIYYKDSIILTMLIYYPYIQLAIIILFILVSYLAFSTSRKADQNEVWVGMSKETAHQLGTPTSSLAGWIEILQHKYPGISITRELALDVQRLEKVTERFSRIGSRPSLASEDITTVISRTVTYLRSRSSSKVKFITDFDTEYEVLVPINATLFEWVIENVAKNAIDAMEGKGDIIFRIHENEKHAIIDITDTGKGIPKSAFKKIFNPGFTTKQKGWGVGLSLARRIIEEYHHGHIFVRHSEVGKGSTIRIVMKKN